MLDKYVVLKEFLALYNQKENKNATSLEGINLKEINVVTKTFYRTKELVKENL